MLDRGRPVRRHIIAEIARHLDSRGMRRPAMLGRQADRDAPRAQLTRNDFRKCAAADVTLADKDQAVNRFLGRQNMGAPNRKLNMRQQQPCETAHGSISRSDQRAIPPAASTASVTSSLAVAVIGAIWTGFSMPISIGPIMSSPPSSRSNLAEMLAL